MMTDRKLAMDAINANSNSFNHPCSEADFNFNNSIKIIVDHANKTNAAKLHTVISGCISSKFVNASFPSLIFVTLLAISLIFGGQYVKDILMYIDTLELWESVLLFALMFILVSFPIVWGYLLLNIACGYTFGFLEGTLITSACANFGILCAHLIMRRFFKTAVERTYVINEQTQSLMRVVSGPNGYKIVILTRLTPIPFGLQNAIFAVSDIKTAPYMLSTITGLFMTQLVYCYMGSTLRSIAEVFSDQNSFTAWLILTFQAAVTILLTVFIIKLAKKELEKNMSSNNSEEDQELQAADPSKPKAVTDSSQKSHTLISFENTPVVDCPQTV